MKQNLVIWCVVFFLTDHYFVKWVMDMLEEQQNTACFSVEY